MEHKLFAIGILPRGCGGRAIAPTVPPVGGQEGGRQKEPRLTMLQGAITRKVFPIPSTGRPPVASAEAVRRRAEATGTEHRAWRCRSSAGEGAFPLRTCGMDDGTARHCRETWLQDISQIIAFKENAFAYGKSKAADIRRRTLVGAGGFEPPTPCTPCRCAPGLRYAPTCGSIIAQRQVRGKVAGAAGFNLGGAHLGRTQGR